MHITHALKPSCRVVFGTAFLLLLAATASAAPSLNRQVSDVMTRLDGFKRFCEDVSDQYRPLRCQANIDLITARLATPGVDPLERKHLRMYRVLERAYYADTLSRRGKPQEAIELITLATRELDEISPKGTGIYPRLRTMILYPALIKSRSELNDAAGVENAEAALRALDLRINNYSSPAEVAAHEYEAGYDIKAVQSYLQYKMDAEQLLSEFYGKQYARSQGAARDKARDHWLAVLLTRRTLTFAHTDFYPASIYHLVMGEETLQIAKLLKEVGNKQGATTAIGEAVQILCTPRNGASEAQLKRYEAGCTEAKRGL